MGYFIEKNKQNYYLLKDGETVTSLNYAKWNYNKATISNSAGSIEVKPQGVFKTGVDIYKDGVDKGDLVFNWKGHIKIILEDDKMGEEIFILKPKGFWTRSYELQNVNERVLFMLRPKFSWRKFGYDFEVDLDTFSFTKDETSKLEELLAYCVYGINLQMARSAATSGAVAS